MRRAAAAAALLLALSAAPAAQAGSSGPFASWSLNGVAAGQTGRLAAASGQLSCSSDDVDGGTAWFDAASGLCAGSDTAGSYNGGSFYYGTLTSTVHSQPVDKLVASWDAQTPAGTWLELHVRVLQDRGWSRWYALPVWASDADTVQRHSVAGQQDGRATVDTDTLIVNPNQPASAYQLEATLFTTSPDISPALKLVTATPSLGLNSAAEGSAWGAELPVPQRSQMLADYRGLGYGGGGEAWCSPTSTSMIMAYWAGMLSLPQLNLSVPTVAAGTYDYSYHGAGNWPLNTAFAASYGLTSYVARLSSFGQIEPWINASVPVAISIAFGPGQLSGSPIPSSPGHFIVVRGFTSSGDVIVNDPAEPDNTRVRTVYDRAQLEALWQAHGGAAYIIYPPGWNVPAPSTAA